MTTTTVLSQSPFQVTIWQPGHAYSPGEVVQPTTTINGGASPPTNADFVGSLTGWTASGSLTWAAGVSYNTNGGAAQVAASSTNQSVVNNNQVAVTVGQTINAYCMGGGNALVFLGLATAFCQLVWYDASHTQIGTTDGTITDIGAGAAGLVWQKLQVSGIAPTGAAYCAVAGICSSNAATFPVYFDAFYWDYIIPNGSATGGNVAYFTSISSGSATSGSSEPDWTNGGTNVGNVTDGGITWARGVQETIQWMCEHFCQSGINEPGTGGVPAWSLTVGAHNPDGLGTPSAFDWVCRTPAVQDTKCPHSKFVVAGASKIFSGDNDIVSFCATTNPLDWSSEADAGFIPTGLQNYGSNPVTAMGLYRSNLVVFNSEGFQMWQLDEDPANMALLDAMPIGSTYHRALAPVNNDLFFLSAQGVRTMGISAGSGNLQAGDVGMPIDVIIQAGIAYAKANNVDPIAVYYPSLGQYWIVFPGWQPSDFFVAIAPGHTPYGSIGDSVFVYTMSRTGEVGAWSRYVFPFPISGFCFNGDDLLIHSEDDVLKVDPSALQDYAGNASASYFPCAVQWPYLDFGPIGFTKQFYSMDITCSQNTGVTVTMYYDQTNPNAVSDPFVISGDSVPGMQIPIPFMCASMGIRLAFSSQDQWQLDALNVYLKDLRPTA